MTLAYARVELCQGCNRPVLVFLAYARVRPASELAELLKVKISRVRAGGSKAWKEYQNE